MGTWCQDTRAKRRGTSREAPPGDQREKSFCSEGQEQNLLEGIKIPGGCNGLPRESLALSYFNEPDPEGKNKHKAPVVACLATEGKKLRQ